MIRRLLRDSAYVLPGLPIAVFGFSLLISLTAASIATAPLGAGALLLPLTLIIASEFAELSRRRLRIWGAMPEPVLYRRRGAGLAGLLRLLGDPRRWLDLIFESLVALPARLVTFVIAVVWIAMGPAGLTYFFWSRFIPGQRGLIQLLEIAAPALLPADPTGRYLLDSAVFFTLGVVFLATLPAVMHGLAWLDAVLATSLLGAGGRGRLPGDGSVAPVSEPQVTPGSAAERASAGASFSARAWSWLGAVFAAVVLLAVGWPVIVVAYQVSVVAAMVVTLAHCGALVLTLRHAWSGIGLSLVAAAATMGVTAESGVGIWPWPVPAMLTQCGVLLVVALRDRWYVAASGWATSALLTVSAVVATTPDLGEGALSTAIVFTAVSAAVVVLGVLIRQWIFNAGRLQASEQDSAQQARRRRELEERNRIARELHDVVAHSMSVISVQAATATYRVPGISDDARREFEEIARSSRQALGEMRNLLGILRGEDDAPTGTTPGLGDIGQLVESTRAAGVTIHAHGLGDLPRVPVSAGLAAYRLVQEALSNALRHAPGSTVEVTARATPVGLLLAVVNTASPEGEVEPSPGAGLGLEGIEERVSAVGGEVETGPTPEGGFRVEARLPLQ
ncbi:sensor histidine kinase [Nesterenkonia suensis]